MQQLFDFLYLSSPRESIETTWVEFKSRRAIVLTQLATLLLPLLWTLWTLWMIMLLSQSLADCPDSRKWLYEVQKGRESSFP